MLTEPYVPLDPNRSPPFTSSLPEASKITPPTTISGEPSPSRSAMAMVAEASAVFQGVTPSAWVDAHLKVPSCSKAMRPPPALPATISTSPSPSMSAAAGVVRDWTRFASL